MHFGIEKYFLTVSSASAETEHLVFQLLFIVNFLSAVYFKYAVEFMCMQSLNLDKQFPSLKLDKQVSVPENKVKSP